MIRARGLSMRYGAKRIFDKVELDVERGGFVLVTGPNGSGKTTLLRLVAGLVAPSAGEIAVDVDRGRLGFLAHEALVYRELTALENLDLYGRLYRVAERRERIGMLLERFDLWDARNERTASFSRGMLQRLALCRVLLHEPELVLLDEPFAAPRRSHEGCCSGSRSAACCSTSRSSCSSTSPLPASTAKARSCSTASWLSGTAGRPSSSRRTSRSSSRRSRPDGWRSHERLLRGRGGARA